MECGITNIKWGHCQWRNVASFMAAVKLGIGSCNAIKRSCACATQFSRTKRDECCARVFTRPIWRAIPKATRKTGLESLAGMDPKARPFAREKRDRF